MARRSTTSSNGTTVISTRSIRCSSVPPRCGSRARGAARRITPVARTPTCCARRSSRAETRALTHPLLTQGAILMHRALLSVAAAAALGALALLAACARPQPAAPGVQWAVIVLYNQPKDTAAFEKYYAEKHVPLFAAHAQEIGRSEEHTSELQSLAYLVCRLLLEKKKKEKRKVIITNNMHSPSTNA